MADIPTNEQYQTTGSTPLVTPKFRYTPSTTYLNLAQIRASGDPFAPAPPAFPGTLQEEQAQQAAISQYGNLVNNGMGIPTQQPFLPPLGDTRSPIPLPFNYGEFAPPMTIDSGGEKLTWGTPTTPMIRNIGGDTTGQYVEDTTDRNLLVKTQRDDMPVVKTAMRNGRPGFMYQVDHIMPLALGGADTLANRQLLTSDQNDKKTKAQAIPYTLYAYGDLSLSEARAMAMQWKNRDLTDVPQPNGVGLVSDTRGKTGIEIARDVAKRWAKPKIPTAKDVIGGIPQAAKDLGKGFLPDSVREFVKGVGSGVTFGFIPYEQGEDESQAAWLSGKAGQLVGGIGSFMLGGALIRGALLVGKLAGGTISAYRGVATAEAAKAGFQVAEAAKVAETTFKTLNTVPGYAKTLLTPENVRRAGKFGAMSVLAGQASQFVQNKFNPGTLSDTAYEVDAGVTQTAGRMFLDLSVGVAGGVMPNTIKGSAGAVMLPLSLSYWANPDDPMGALTDGVVFGALHVAGAIKSPGYNNVQMLGGKPYSSPVMKSFEDTVNKASYASLSHYAPDVMPVLKPGEMIPASAHNPQTVQTAKDTAIENVWKRFFFGKEVAPAVQQKTLSDFKGFSQGLDDSLNASTIPGLSGLSRLSRSARKARSTAVKDEKAKIADTFGKDYQSRNTFSGDTSILPEVGMDLQIALTEIKRITVASRQLYKGGLTGELRNKADVDDLLSFSKNNLQKRFDSMERFTNPPIAQQAVDSIDESFMQRSFNNDRTSPSGKYPNGDLALTGAALKINKAGATYFFQQRDLGNASPNILLIDRADTAPLWSMRNQLLDQADIAANKYAADPNPSYSLQAFGVIKDPQTGKKELVPLGWVASDFRLNTATGEGHTAFNQHPLVLKYKETNGVEGMRPLDLHKDQIAPVMHKEGVSVLVANLDSRATLATLETGNPFIPLNINDKNWEYSKALGQRLSQQESKNPISMDIARVSNTLDAKQKTDAINQMNRNVTRPASSYIPASVTPVSPQGDRMTQPREATRSTLQTVEQSIDAIDPGALKDSFKKNFGVVLTDAQASDLFQRRHELIVRDGIKVMVDAVNNGNVDTLTRVKLDFVKMYLESGALQASAGGAAIPDMLLLGRMKNIATRGQEEHTLPTEVTSTTKPLDLTNYRKTAEATQITPQSIHDLADKRGIPWDNDQGFMNMTKSLTGKEHLDDLTGPELKTVYDDILKAQEPGTQGTSIPTSITPSASPATAGLAEKIVSRAGQEMPNLRNQFRSEPRQSVEDVLNPKKNEDYPDEIRAIWAETPGARGQELVNAERAGQQFMPSKKDAEPLSTPRLFADEFYRGIDEGKASEKSSAQFWNKALDKGLQDMFGPKYRENSKVAQILDEYFNGKGTFFNFKNREGREIQQIPEYAERLAAGDFEGANKAIETRRIDLLKAKGFSDGQIQNLIKKYGGVRNIPKGTIPKNVIQHEIGDTGGNMSETALRNLGLNPEDLMSSSVRPGHQEGLIGDLSRGENLMLAIFADGGPTTGKQAVLSARKLFLGEGKTGADGLKSFILARYPSAKRSIALDQLEHAATVADISSAIHNKVNETKLAEAENLLPLLKKESESLQKAIDDPLDRANWQTPEILNAGLADVVAKIAKYSKLVDEAKGDGSGGPGYQDGAGGPGSLLGSVGGAIGGLWNKISGKTVYDAPSVSPEPPPPNPVASPKVPSQYASVMVQAAKHTGIPEDTMARHFNAENMGLWDSKQIGKADPTDFGVTQLNPSGVSMINGTAYKGGTNFFKQNFGHEFDRTNGNDQILGAATYLNWLKQYGLPAAGIKNPKLKDQLLAYNMGPTGYAASLAPNAPADLVTRRERYTALLKRSGINLDATIAAR